VATVEAVEFSMTSGVAKGSLDDLTAFSVARLNRFAIHLLTLSIEQFLSFKAFDPSTAIRILLSVRMKVRGVLEAPSIAAFCLIGRGLTCKVVCKRQPSRWPATHDKPAFHRVF
jgi:hypothetical protein